MFTLPRLCRNSLSAYTPYHTVLTQASPSSHKIQDSNPIWLPRWTSYPSSSYSKKASALLWKQRREEDALPSLSVEAAAGYGGGIPIISALGEEKGTRSLVLVMTTEPEA